jgi:hypothetical protein
MQPLYLIAASGLALTVAACGPKTPPARAALECPLKQGDLTRTSASPDGKMCAYRTAEGAEVTLQLVSVSGGVDTTLSNIEANLLANRVKHEEATAQGVDEEAQKEAEAAVAEAKADAEAAGVKIEVGKDGKASVVTEDGGTTRVNLPGVHIVANDAEDTAEVKVGPININAGDDGATVRIRRDVRLRGEALSPERRGLRATFIYKGDDLPDGYRFVGYEAGGPKTGPITVAVVRSKADVHGDEIYSDVKKLVRENGGV